MHRNSTEPTTLTREANFQIAPKIGAVSELAPDVAAMRHIMVNVFFIGEPGSTAWTLVDGGLASAAEPILRAAAKRFGPDAPPKNILLTHGHFDHIGALRKLARHWDIDIFAHPLELPYLTGRSSYPPPDPPVGGGAMAWSSLLYPKKPTDLTPFVKPLPSNGSVPGLPEWRWLHTPGHAPGQVAFFRQRDRTLLAGDAFVTTRQESMLAVMSQTPEINGPPAYFTPDWNAARASVQHLASLNPEAVGTGHGPAMRGERMRQELHELANRFDAVARPVRGRYVHRSAQTGVNGVIDVPPVTALQTALTGAALLLALGAITTAFMRRRD